MGSTTSAESNSSPEWSAAAPSVAASSTSWMDFQAKKEGLDRLTLGEDGAIWQEIHIVVSE